MRVWRITMVLINKPELLHFVKENKSDNTQWWQIGEKTEMLIATVCGDANLENNLTIPSKLEAVMAELTNFTPVGPFLYY